MNKQKENDIPKAVAEGDKLPEEKKGREEKDEMNEPRKIKGNKDAPKANAEGDKLPEEGREKQD